MLLFAYCPPALPPCLGAGRIRGLTLSPVSLCSLPASSCTHLDRPHGLSFRLSSPPDADGHRSFSPLRAFCTPVPLRSDFPPRDSSTVPCPPCGGPARQTDIRLPRGIICPTGNGPPPLPCLPDLPLPVEHTHIAVPCHFASSPPADCPPIKRRGRKAGASLPPVSAAVTAHHKSCPRCT